MIYLWNSKSKIAFECISVLECNKKCNKICEVIPKELIHDVMGLVMKWGVKTEAGCNSWSLKIQNSVESQCHFLWSNIIFTSVTQIFLPQVSCGEVFKVGINILLLLLFCLAWIFFLISHIFLIKRVKDKGIILIIFFPFAMFFT